MCVCSELSPKTTHDEVELNTYHTVSAAQYKNDLAPPQTSPWGRETAKNVLLESLSFGLVDTNDILELVKATG